MSYWPYRQNGKHTSFFILKPLLCFKFHFIKKNPNKPWNQLHIKLKFWLNCTSACWDLPEMAETILGKHSTDVILWGISLDRVLLWLILYCSQPPGGWILFCNCSSLCILINTVTEVKCTKTVVVTPFQKTGRQWKQCFLIQLDVSVIATSSWNPPCVKSKAAAVWIQLQLMTILCKMTTKISLNSHANVSFWGTWPVFNLLVYATVEACEWTADRRS